MWLHVGTLAAPYTADSSSESLSRESSAKLGEASPPRYSEQVDRIHPPRRWPSTRGPPGVVGGNRAEFQAFWQVPWTEVERRGNIGEPKPPLQLAGQNMRSVPRSLEIAENSGDNWRPRRARPAPLGNSRKTSSGNLVGKSPPTFSGVSLKSAFSGAAEVAHCMVRRCASAQRHCWLIGRPFATARGASRSSARARAARAPARPSPWCLAPRAGLGEGGGRPSSANTWPRSEASSPADLPIRAGGQQRSPSHSESEHFPLCAHRGTLKRAPHRYAHLCAPATQPVVVHELLNPAVATAAA